MEENNKYETKENRSGSALYGSEPQQQEEENIYSSAYGTKLEPQDTVSSVQLTKPSETENMQKIASLSQPVEAEPIQDIETPSQPVETKPAQENISPQPVFPQQNFMGGNSMGFGPVQAPPPVQGAPISQPKKKKTGLIAGILCAAAVLIAVGAGVLLVKSLFGGNAEKQLAKGFANMAREMAAYQNSAVGDIGLAELNKLKKTKPMHTNIDLSVTDPESSGTFSNISMEMDAVIDYSQKMAEYDLSLGTYGIEMNIGKMIAADNVLYLSAPIIFQNQVYSLDCTNLGRDFNKSAWSEIVDEKLPEDYSLTLFGDTDLSESIKKTGEMGELYNLFQNQIKVIMKATKMETLKEKREFSFEEGFAECGGVQVAIDKDTYNQAMKTLCDDILKSNYYTEFMKGYETTFRGDFDELKEQMDSIIKHMFGIRFEQDIVLDFYLDKKGRIVNISTPEDLAVSSDYTDIDYLAVDIGFSGTERALDWIEGGIYLQAGEEILYLGISRMADITEDSYTEDLTLLLQDDSSNDEIAFWYIGSWGYEDQSYELQMQMDLPENSIGLSAEGAYTDIKKGERYTVQIDHAAITIDEEDILLMSGSITTEPTENQIEVPENTINVLEMSERDITSLLYGILY